MRFTAFIAGVAALLACQSCTDDLSPYIPHGPLYPFSLRISVVDTVGRPVQNLRISCWNKLKPISGLPPVAADTLPLTMASSSIYLDMPAKAKVWMALYDLNDRIVLALYSDNTLWGPGVLRASFVTGDYRTPRVFKCRCIVQDDRSNILYRDSIYALCWQPYAERSILGWTSGDGTFSSSDPLLFPNVFPLPPLVHTGESGSETLGTFALSDTLTFALVDTSTHGLQFAEGVVRGLIDNELHFVWNPTIQPHPGGEVAPHAARSIVARTDLLDRAGSEWRLHQNYPNPYYR